MSWEDASSIHLASHQSCSYEAVKTFLNQKCSAFDFEKRVPWLLPNDQIWVTQSQREGWIWDHSLKCHSRWDTWAAIIFKKVLERYDARGLLTPATDPLGLCCLSAHHAGPLQRPIRCSQREVQLLQPIKWPPHLLFSIFNFRQPATSSILCP